MAKNVQISEKLFLQLYSYFQDNEVALSQHDSIKEQLQNKFDSMVKRMYYTDYKTAETPQEREKARQAYLDSVGMNDNYRTK